MSIGNDIIGFPQNLIAVDETYFMGGMFYGFETQRQTILANKDDRNTVLMRLEFVNGFAGKQQFQSECLYQGKLGRRDLDDIDTYDKGESEYTLLRRNDFDVPKSNVGKSVLNAYYSKYP